MEYAIALILGLLGVIFVQFRAKQSSDVKAALGDTLGQDKQLQKTQHTLQDAISEIDERLKVVKDQREQEEMARKIEESMTLQERAAKARSKFNK